MSLENLAALFLFLLVGWLWLTTLQAREQALAHAKRACARHGLQLLDQTVAVRGVTLLWTASGVRLKRTYGFEYSEEGVDRRIGRIVLVGMTLASLSLHAEDSAGGDPDTEGTAPDRPKPGADGSDGTFGA
jgi:hypothetical protein